MSWCCGIISCRDLGDQGVFTVYFIYVSILFSNNNCFAFLETYFEGAPLLQHCFLRGEPRLYVIFVACSVKAFDFKLTLLRGAGTRMASFLCNVLFVADEECSHQYHPFPKVWLDRSEYLSQGRRPGY